jgi:hypothetical protein
MAISEVIDLKAKIPNPHKVKYHMDHGVTGRAEVTSL